MTVRDWSEAHFRMVAVRVLELAALLLVAVAALEMWVGWSGPVFSDGAGGGSPPFDFRVWSVTMALFRGPIGLVVAAVLLGLCLAVIHRLRPVAHAGVLRWEVGAVAVAGLLVEVVALVAVGLAFVTPLPFGGGSEKAFYLANAVGLTLAGTLPLVLVALWWWRLLGEPDPESDAAGAVESDADEVGDSTPPPPAPGGPVRPAGRAADLGTRPDTAVDGVLGDPSGVERIEPVSRDAAIDSLSSDGSTSNGYDDYFRRR